ncbi:MAG: DUF1778 domain-containing protein [Bacteroidetes bacterium]|nr:MAG: DUF1778 domain-containing protein [Bacteroidota bacterium]
MANKEMARFNARLTKEQKEFFEYASRLGGFRSLTDFIIQSAQSKAKEIIKEHNRILASRRDQEIFFEALLQPEAPGQELRDAAAAYKRALER